MGKLALVTGATAGIGRAYAERLAADGYDLVVVGRREDRLAAFADTHREVKVRTVIGPFHQRGRRPGAEICATEPLTVLVNNAGVAHYMPLADLPAGKAVELVNVKVLAPTMLARAAVGGMQERGAGTIINVAGMIAFSGPAPHTPRRPVASSTQAVWPTSSRCLRPSARNWKEPELSCKSCAPASWPPSSTSARAWTSARCPG
jgi:short-subunit dehydrogenase